MIMMKDEEENIFKLCKKSDINLLRKFLKEINKERMIDVVNDIDMDMEEMTPLMYASSGGFTEAVEELVLCGAEVNSQSQYGMTACYFAASGGHSACLEALIRLGADVMIPALKDLPINVALRKGRGTCVDLLLKAGDYCSVTNLYHDAIESRDVSMCKKLLEHGYTHIDGMHDFKTPLHCAAYEGLREMVEFFVQHGANLELGDKDGRSALLAATASGHAEIVDQLVRHGSNISAKDNTYSQLSAVHIAAQLGHMDCLVVLTNAGADLDVCDNRGLTPLMRTIASGDTQPATFLIRENACLHSTTLRDSFNDALRQFLTVVDLAIVSKMYKIAEVLLECGACFGDQLFDFPVADTGQRDWHPLRRILALRQVDSGHEMNRFIQWYIRFKENPGSLKHLSRLSIRGCLKCPLASELRHLPLPSSVKQYLYLEDLISERFGGEFSSSAAEKDHSLAYYMPALWINHDPNIYA